MKQERGSIAPFHTIIAVLCQMDRNLLSDAAGDANYQSDWCV